MKKPSKSTDTCQLAVADVFGPSPGQEKCFIIMGSPSGMFPLHSSYSNAQACHDLLCDYPHLPNAYEFFRDASTAIGISIDRCVLDAADGAVIAKIFLSCKGKKMKIVSTDVISGINTALAAKAQVEATKSFSALIKDSSSQYTHLKTSVGILWPLSKVDKTDVLRSISELMDMVVVGEDHEG